MARDDERDFGMAGGRDPGPGIGGHPGIGMEAIDADVVAAIAAELEAGADAGAQPSFSSPTGPEGALQAETVRQAIAQQVAASQANTGFSTATGAGGFTGGSQLYDMGMDPTFANTGGWGVPQNTVMNPFAAPVVAAGVGLNTANNAANQFAGSVLDRVPGYSDYVNQLGETVPNTWDNPYVSQNYDDWGQAGTSNVNQTAISRALAGPDPTTNWAGGFNPQLDSHPSDWENVTQGMNPQGIPDYSSPTSPEGALAGPGRPAFSSPFSPEGALTADQIGPTSPFTSPTSPEGALAGPISPYDASLALDEYEIPSRQQQRRAASVAASPFDAGVVPGTPMAPAFSSPFSPEGALTAGISIPDSDIEVSVSDAIFSLNQAGANITSQDFQTISEQLVYDDDVETAVDNSVTTGPVKDAVKQGKKLTAQEKKNNIDKRRAAEKGWLAYSNELKDEMKDAIQEHGILSKEARKASAAYREWTGWMNNNVNNPDKLSNMPFGIGYIGKTFKTVEDYFHSLGKTERRTAQEILKDMEKNPEKYERIGAEVSEAQLVRNMYPFLRKAPMDVAAAAAREPAYLRYLINLNVNKQPIPTSYSSNWKNDISDAWIYG